MIECFIVKLKLINAAVKNRKTLLIVDLNLHF